MWTVENLVTSLGNLYPVGGPGAQRESKTMCPSSRASFCLPFVAIVLLAGANPASAAGTCSINSMTNVVFGNVDVTTGSPVDTTGTLQVSCSGFGAAARLCINIAVGSAGDATSRQMQSGANTLRYDLYTDPARTTIWGSWETGYKSPGVAVDVADGTHNFTVYARLFGSQQSAASGSYTSTFTANPFMRWGQVGGSGACPAQPNNGGTDTATFQVTATVTPNCNVNTASVNFGSVGLLTSNIDASGTVNVTCTNGAPYNVGLDAGNGAGATVAARKMTNGAYTVTYSLYSNVGRTTVWGNTIGSNTVTGTGTGSNQALTVYGRVPPQTSQPPGTYTDTVVVTVTY